MTSEFLLLCIYGPLIRDYIEAKSKGSTVGHLRVGEVGSLPCAVPPVEEQIQICSVIGAAMDEFDKLTAEAARAIALLKERRAALISAAVTGKIDVRGLVSAEAHAA